MPEFIEFLTELDFIISFNNDYMHPYPDGQFDIQVGGFGNFTWKSQIGYVVIGFQNSEGYADEFVQFSFKELCNFQKTMKGRQDVTGTIVVDVYNKFNKFHYTLVFDH